MGAPRLILAAVLAAAALPTTASAAEVHVEGTTVVFTAAPGEQNLVTVGLPSETPDQFTINENGGAPLTVQAPCTAVEEGGGFTARCPTSLVTDARIQLGDQKDTLQNAAFDDPSSTAPALPLTVDGGAGDDFMTGSQIGDTIDGGDGDDQINAFTGDDKVKGGAGKDLLLGATGNDTLDGGADADDMIGEEGDDNLVGGDGNDSIGGGVGSDTLDGQGGVDELRGDEASDNIVGGPGIDTVNAGPGDDNLDLRDGERENGHIRCGGGDDTVRVDPRDGVAEYKDHGSNVTESSCEHIIGQKAPKPVHFFTKGVVKKDRLAFVIDLISGFTGTYTLKITYGGKTVGGGKIRYGQAPRAKGSVKVKRSFAKKARGFYAVKITLTNRDSGGRVGTYTFKTTLFTDS